MKYRPNANGRDPQFAVTPLVIIALVQRVATEITETQRHGKPIRELLRVTWRELITVYFPCLSLPRPPKHNRGDGTGSNTEMNGTHSDHSSTYHFWFHVSSF
jgi:hypothetical protein